MQLCEFKKINGHFNLPKDYKDKSLIGWISKQREYYRNNSINADRLSKLDAIGFVWDPLNDEWNKQFNALQNYRKLHPNAWPSTIGRSPDEKKLGSWCGTQRQRYKEDNLSPERINKLNEIGFTWSFKKIKGT